MRRNFDGLNFLKKLSGRSVMFVGDSISQDHWTSLACILTKQVPQAKYTLTMPTNDIKMLTFTEYGVKIMVNWNQYLVDIVNDKKGRIIKIDSVELNAQLWEDVDILIFNSFHWWSRKSWDYVQVGNQLVQDVDAMTLFEKALDTWALWAEKIDPSRKKIFFQGISPTHYNSSEWNEPKANGCLGQTTPIPGMTYPGGDPFSLTVMKRALRSVLEKKTVTLLDITELSQLRKDGHPSIYGQNGASRSDCLHWCLGGVPDTWNEILYALIFPKSGMDPGYY
ncbi:hypothetical protein LIER_21099 [Lithospermum erythrorhizon]|uniref:Trichome birefringence-like C-terminal domain-containing protein n=1 Tax=Lithospermum erythrorhizon TaxID=34254 RepID=A0AAV3QSE2_LITER